MIMLFIGELSLMARSGGCNGVLPMLLKAREDCVGSVFVPYENKTEASVVNGIDIFFRLRIYMKF